jgi:predicted acetyltransferase
VSATRDEAPVLANLLELYIHDFSELIDVELDGDGRFGYPDLALYWSDPARYPFLIKTDATLAGLALVKRMRGLLRDEMVWDVAEFFVVRGHRKRGIGTLAAHALWRQRPGKWQVRVMESNAAAARFWERAVARFTNDNTTPVDVEKDGRRWRVFSFSS